MNPSTLNANAHDRTIIHVDMDCFYAQVEMNKNPSLFDKPLGIQQKNIVVTCNYIAREYGVKKCMLITDAQKTCPNLVLVNGEDLHDYRQISYKVTTFLQQFTPLVERLGMDENYLDVTNLVKTRLGSDCVNKVCSFNALKPVGHIFGDLKFDEDDDCDCGCFERLTMGTIIAKEIRDALKANFQLTSCAGIAHNKLLAKIVGGIHKPNQQTVLYPNNALELMNSLASFAMIPGIGKVMEEILTKECLKLDDLQCIENLGRLKTLFGAEKGRLIHNLSLGIDNSLVKPSGKPQSIGLEDSFKKITAVGEVKEKFLYLLTRLMILVSEDGRIPRTIKITIRLFDVLKKTSHKETKQTNLNTSLFTIENTKIRLNPQSNEKIISIIMNLANKIISNHINKPYNITLLGLSFTKFIERAKKSSSISSFLRKNVEVQSITNIEHKTDLTPMECSSISMPEVTTMTTDGSESDYEPSPKKKIKRRSFPAIISKKRSSCFDQDLPSPSKLKVADLHLSNNDGSADDFENATSSSSSLKPIQCPLNASEEVFRVLPRDIQEELWAEYTASSAVASVRSSSCKEERENGTKPKINTLLNYFVKNC
nr:DNA polymerase iota [Onthophagus taurus]XP_022920537.1 DNA polymerase iota [Onthophagus taurus]